MFFSKDPETCKQFNKQAIGMMQQSEKGLEKLGRKKAKLFLLHFLRKISLSE